MLDKLTSDGDALARPSAPSRTTLAVLIVGMHRSGTSALSGVLNLLGVAVPEDLHPADEHNTKGYFEPARIIDFHEALLAKLGSPSNDPLPLTYDWVDSPVGKAAAEELADILDEEFGDNALCLFKDPRICRLAPVWTAALKQTGRAGVAILPCRHPLEVAESLRVKGGLSRPYSLFMWLQHVVLGEYFTRDLPRSFNFYDALLDDWRSVVSDVQRDLGIVWPRDLLRAAPDIDTFLSAELRHHQTNPKALEPHDPLDALCARAWAALQVLNQAPYDVEAMAEMDALWRDLKQAFGVFAPLVVSYQRDIALARDWDKVRDEHVRNLDRRIEDAEKARAATRARLARREADLDWTRKEVRIRDGIMGDLRDQVAHRDNLLTNASAGLARLEAIEASNSWKLMATLQRPFKRTPGLRRVVRGTLKLGWWVATLKLGRKLRERQAASDAVPSPVLIEAGDKGSAGPLEPIVSSVVGSALASRSSIPHIAFVSGEPDTPGHTYRVVRYAEAARTIGATTSITRADQLEQGRDHFARADMIFVWRATWTDALAAVVMEARKLGTPVLFDIDDLLVEPEQAKTEIIDGIRSQNFAEEEIRSQFELIQQTFLAANYASAPTEALTQRLRRHSHPAFLLPNGFDDNVRSRSRMAARRRRQEQDDGLVRIGYATGSKTHQKDFAAAGEAVSRILRAYPQTRLVLFKNKWGDVLDIGEFADFDSLEDQIEWRDMVPIDQLPDELARFDINLAPLEVGNIFCEAKSELKFFEAALVDVPTVASPTGAFKGAIRPGETGFLANTVEEWHAALKQLMDPGLRRRIAAAAQLDVLAEYGPERRAEHFALVMEQVLGRGGRAARAFELALFRAAKPRPAPPRVPPHEIIYEADYLQPSAVTVIIPLYNYAGFVREALQSVHDQTLKDLDLVVVDDASSDDSLAVAKAWIEDNAGRFNRIVLARNIQNAGLGFTRNVGFANADTPFVLPLDADNRLAADCAEVLLEAVRASGAAYAYPELRQFGDEALTYEGRSYDPARFVVANYIDAMALVRRSAWVSAGGYDHVRFGWEDYDFWCRLVELGLFGQFVPKPLAEYRVHQTSMLRSETDALRNKIKLADDIERRHPWVHIDRAPPTGMSFDKAPSAE